MPNQTAIEGLDLSREFYSNPNNYGPFSLTDDHRRMLGCMDPRDPEGVEHGKIKILVQTAGGGAGEGLDSALAQTAHTGELVTIEQGAERDSLQRLTTVLGGHHRCLFIASLGLVLGEMTEPGDFTKDSLVRWASYLGREETVSTYLDNIKKSAEEQRNYIYRRDNMDHLVGHLDELYPDHKNVGHMVGDNTARVYVMDFHPHVGIDRNKKPTVPEQALTIQGYHDNLAASTADIANIQNLSGVKRGLRFTAAVLRAAAVRTVVTQEHMDETAFFEAQQTKSGLQIFEQV